MGKTVWLVALSALLMMGMEPCLSGAVLLRGSEEGGKENNQQDTEAVIIAALGYEDQAGSIITVKVYDANCGRVLSDNAYELIVKDDLDESASGWTARIFAGGTGIEPADHRSSIVLRVYDAETGAFQWLGRLHVDPPAFGNQETYPVAASMPRRASLTRIDNADGIGIAQPLFVLRAWDVSTGTLLWEDAFIPEQQVYPIAKGTDRRKTVHKGDHRGDRVDFRVLMVDQERREIVWQDQMVQTWRNRQSPRSFEESPPRFSRRLVRFQTSWPRNQAD
ncbi:MAG: hypothetical protein NNA18_00400 [Nitrospira sp.]|nr:hypothetical protein [Nitrospira sp.]